MPPTKSREAGESSIGREPFAAPFDRERRMIGVGNQVSLGISPSAEIEEDLPVPGAGSDDRHFRTGTDVVDEINRRGQRGRRVETLGMSDDAKTTAQGQLGHADA